MFRDIFRKFIFTVIADNAIQFSFFITVNNVTGSLCLSLIHAHVKRCIYPIGKSTFLIVQLIGGYSQIQNNTINLVNSPCGKLLYHVTIIAANDCHLVKGGKPFTRSNYRILVLIYTNKSPLGRKFPAYLTGMPCTS